VKIPGVTKDVGVSFVGQPHGDRRSVIGALKAAGVDVQAYGSGWPKRLSFDEMILMFNRTKVNLNLNNAADVQYKQIKGRNFEVPACGGFLLTGAPENLGEYYEAGKEVAVFSGTRDLVDKTRYYLAHDEERERIAAAGHERTAREHLAKHRLDDIFSKARLI
jgi:spore maturation protein CgeB